MQQISNEIILRAAEGQIEAFEEIYKVSSGYVYTVAFRVTNNREDAEEVTQDVFIKIYRNLKKFQFRSSFKTWAYRITVNMAINLINRRKRKKGKTVSYDEDIDHKTSMERSEERIAEDTKKDNEELVENMLKILPPKLRTCIVLKDIEGLRYKEISEILKININTVRSRLKRARERLISRYGKGGSYHEVQKD